jgi:hypothetical protein
LSLIIIKALAHATVGRQVDFSILVKNPPKPKSSGLASLGSHSGAGAFWVLQNTLIQHVKRV